MLARQRNKMEMVLCIIKTSYERLAYNWKPQNGIILYATDFRKAGWVRSFNVSLAYFTQISLLFNTIQCTIPFLHQFKNSVAGQIGSSRTATSTSSLLSNLLHRPKHESDGATSRPLNGPEVTSQTLAKILVSHVRSVALFYLPAGTNPTTDDQLFSHKYPHVVAAPSQQTFTLTDVHRGMNSTWMTLLTSQNTDNTKADCFHRIPARFDCGAKWCTHVSTLLF
jgi:hypothetical protein